MVTALLTVAGAVTALTVIARFSPLRRLAKFLWCRNISEPLTQKADDIVTGVVQRELKERNGGYSLADLRDQLDNLRLGITERFNVVQTQQEMHGERLKFIGQTARATADQLTEHMDNVAESGILKHHIESRVDKARNNRR